MNTTHDFTASKPSTAPGRTNSFALTRPSDDRMVAGVCSGIARAFGIDPLIVRIAFIVLTLAGAAGIPLYLAGWLLIPDEESQESIAAQLFQSVSGKSQR